MVVKMVTRSVLTMCVCALHCIAEGTILVVGFEQAIWGFALVFTFTLRYDEVARKINERLQFYVKPLVGTCSTLRWVLLPTLTCKPCIGLVCFLRAEYRLTSSKTTQEKATQILNVDIGLLAHTHGLRLYGLRDDCHWNDSQHASMWLQRLSICTDVWAHDQIATCTQQNWKESFIPRTPTIWGHFN